MSVFFTRGEKGEEERSNTQVKISSFFLAARDDHTTQGTSGKRRTGFRRMYVCCMLYVASLLFLQKRGVEKS